MDSKILTYEEEKQRLEKTSKLLQFLKAHKGETYLKSTLAAYFNVSERQIRREMSEIARFYPVVATSDSRGYTLIEDITKENAELVEHEINELISRIEKLQVRLKPLIAYKKTSDVVLSK